MLDLIADVWAWIYTIFTKTPIGLVLLIVALLPKRKKK